METKAIPTQVIDLPLVESYYQRATPWHCNLTPRPINPLVTQPATEPPTLQVDSIPFPLGAQIEAAWHIDGREMAPAVFLVLAVGSNHDIQRLYLRFSAQEHHERYTLQVIDTHQGLVITDGDHTHNVAVGDSLRTALAMMEILTPFQLPPPLTTFRPGVINAGTPEVLRDHPHVMDALNRAPYSYLAGRPTSGRPFAMLMGKANLPTEKTLVLISMPTQANGAGSADQRSLLLCEVAGDATLTPIWMLMVYLPPHRRSIDGLGWLLAKDGSDELPPALLLPLAFLAATYNLTDDQRNAWLPSLAVAMETTTSTITDLYTGKVSDYKEAEHVIGEPWLFLEMLINYGHRQWEAPFSAVDLEEVLTAEQPTGTSLASTVAEMVRWHLAPPTRHPQTPRGCTIHGLINTQVGRAIMLLTAPPIQEPTKAWLVRPAAPIWIPWYNPDFVIGLANGDRRANYLGLSAISLAKDPALAQAEPLLRATAGELSREAELGPPLVGRFVVLLPPQLSTLTAYTVSRIEVDALTPSYRWIRVSPDEGEADGVVLPWRLGAEPPAEWGVVLPKRLTWGIHLALCGWERDMRRVGREQVVFTATSAGPTSDPNRTQRGKQRGRLPPPVIQAPRPRTERITLTGSTQPIETVAYGSPEDREEVSRRVTSAHPVQAHLVRYVNSQWRASEAKRAAFARLPLEARLERYGITALPEQGMTIRGLQVDEKGDIISTYQRGRIQGDTPARPVLATGLLAVSLVMRVINDAQFTVAADSATKEDPPVLAS